MRQTKTGNKGRACLHLQPKQNAILESDKGILARKRGSKVFKCGRIQIKFSETRIQCASEYKKKIQVKVWTINKILLYEWFKCAPSNNYQLLEVCYKIRKALEMAMENVKNFVASNGLKYQNQVR